MFGLRLFTAFMVSGKVVISGLGVVSPLGIETDQFWNGLVEGRSGVRPFHFTREGDSPIPFAASCADFTGDIENFGEENPAKKKTIKKATKLMSREIQLAVASAQKALKDAKYDRLENDDLACRVGVSFGCDLIYSTVEDLLDGIIACTEKNADNAGDTDSSSLGSSLKFDFSKWAELGMTKMTPLWQLKYLSNMPSSHIAIINEFRGTNNSILLRETSIGAVASETVQMIRAGKIDLAIIGATGSKIHPVKMVQAIHNDELAHAAENGDYKSLSRPFDKNRMGMVLGEGAGALILESYEHAVARGAKIYGEIVCGSTTACPDKYAKFGSNSGTNGVETALHNVMKNIFAESEYILGRPFELNALGHINANGLGTKSADIAEAQAIRKFFADRETPLPITTVKGHFGNLGAGSGAIELIASVLAMQEGKLFPTLNFTESDPDCGVCPVKSGETVMSGDSFLKLSFNSQGQASGVLVRKCV
ncbi:MAG: beta-ketoacyl-[acyl-carrier-protein] synthase family protein [Thermoguttaceae bacterium]